MGNQFEVGRIAEFDNGMTKEIEVQGRQIILARVRDKYYAISSLCPHMGGRLAQGKLEGTIITCPLHGSQFDVSDGHVVNWLKKLGVFSSVGKVFKGPRPLATYEVNVEGGKILITL